MMTMAPAVTDAAILINDSSYTFEGFVVAVIFGLVVGYLIQ